MQALSSALQGHCLASSLLYWPCPLTVLTQFGGKEVGEPWHFLSWFPVVQTLWTAQSGVQDIFPLLGG